TRQPSPRRRQGRFCASSNSPFQAETGPTRSDSLRGLAPVSRGASSQTGSSFAFFLHFVRAAPCFFLHFLSAAARCPVGPAGGGVEPPPGGGVVVQGGSAVLGSPKRCTRSFELSATHAAPRQSIVTRKGALSWPAPLPLLPARQVLAVVQFSNAAAPLSTPQPNARVNEGPAVPNTLIRLFC